MFEQNLTVEKLTDAIEKQHVKLGCNPFKIKKENGLIVFKYSYAYPDVFKGENEFLLRECRGSIFDEKSGKLLSRPYHKFFNVAEHPETSLSNLDLDPETMVLEKLDGSMIRPLFYDNKLCYATKSGYTTVSKQVDEWSIGKENYNQFCVHWINEGYTPIFEWCSNKMRIVINHPVDRLILTNIRNNQTGEYLSYKKLKSAAKEFDIELVEKYEITENSFENLIRKSKSLKEQEGFVVMWSSGLIVKLKADEYLKFHRSLNLFKSKKTMIDLIVGDNIDDIIPTLKNSDVKIVYEYQKRIHNNIESLAIKISNFACEVFKTTKTRKEFALQVKNKPNSQIYFKLNQKFLLESNSEQILLVKEIIKDLILKTSKVEKIESLVGDFGWGSGGLNFE